MRMCLVQLSAVKDACCQYMKDCLGKDTAVATLLLAAKFSCKDVHVHAQSYIAGTFHTMRPDALKECPRPIFWDLISRNDLSVNSELQVSCKQQTIIVWWRHCLMRSSVSKRSLHSHLSCLIPPNCHVVQYLCDHLLIIPSW